MKKKQSKKAVHSPKKDSPVKRSRRPSASIYISLLLISIFVFTITIYKITEYILSQTNTENSFPKLEIALSEVPIEQINMNSKDIKYPGNTAILTINENSTNFSDVEIKGRGNANWNQIKKPYQIKFSDKVSLLNLPESKKWVLIANYLDRSYIRTDFAYYLERLLSESFALNGDYLELYIDNMYWGLYYASEKIEIKKNRVDLKDNYGAIVELDNLHTPIEDCHFTTSNNCIAIKDAVNEDNTSAIIENIVSTVSQLESATKQKDYARISSLIDVDSFAKYYLLNEFTINPDAYSSSFYLYKDGLNDKLYAGPGWDFDFSLSNTLWHVDGLNRDSYFSPSTNNAAKEYYDTFKNSSPMPYYAKNFSTLLFDLIEIPEFLQRVRGIYQSTISGHGAELTSYIRSRADYIRDAAYRDQDRWKLDTDFNEEVNYLVDWVTKRYDHFEETYGVNSNSAAAYENNLDDAINSKTTAE